MVVAGVARSPEAMAQATRRIHIVPGPRTMGDPANPDPATQARCRQYAGQATEGARRNVELHWKLTGPRWTTDEHAHYQWCLGAPEKYRASEHVAQRNALKDCEASQTRRFD
jgi:hypothetical protein